MTSTAEGQRAVDESRLARWERRLDLPLTASTIIFVVAYAWPILQPDLSPTLDAGCRIAVWVVWAMLAVDLTVRLGLSDDRRAFLRHHPIDLVVVVLPILRPLRLLRLVTLLSRLNRFATTSLRGRVGLYVVGAATLIMFVGSLAELDAERGRGARQPGAVSRVVHQFAPKHVA